MTQRHRGPRGPYTLTTAMYLLQRGVRPEVTRRWGSTFGRLAKRRFMQLNGHAPEKVYRQINGVPRPVFVYRACDEPMLDEVWSDLVKRRGLQT